MTYNEFIQQVQFLKDKIILPDGTRVSKDRWITSKGFNFDALNKYLLTTYNNKYAKNK